MFYIQSARTDLKAVDYVKVIKWNDNKDVETENYSIVIKTHCPLLKV